MSYKINSPNTNPPDVTAGGPVTMTDVENFFAGNESPEFYELETAEVVEIYLDENDLPLNKDGDPDWLKYGWAKVRMSVSSKRDTDIVEAQPLNSNIKEYPLPGEFVIVADKYLGGRYYTQKINANNSVNFNYLPGFSTPDATMQTITNQTIKNFRPDSRIRQLQAEEGDITFNGRFGQSIRFGSNIVNLLGNRYAPNILMRVGQGIAEPIPFKPVNENINLDGSSIWITSDQRVALDYKNYNIPMHYQLEELGMEKFITFENQDRQLYETTSNWGFGGNQIILNSDRLVFNTKRDALLMSSMTNIGLSANKEIGLEVPNNIGRVMLGDVTPDRDDPAMQPVLGGDQTMKHFANLIDSISEFAGILTTAVAGPGLPWKPTNLTPINAAASQLRASLQALKKRLDEPKSKTVFVGHIKGPSPFTPPKKPKKPNRETETAAWIKAARYGLQAQQYPTDYEEHLASEGCGSINPNAPEGANTIERLPDPVCPTGYKPVGFTETTTSRLYYSGTSDISPKGTHVITNHSLVATVVIHDHTISLECEPDDGKISIPRF